MDRLNGAQRVCELYLLKLFGRAGTFNEPLEEVALSSNSKASRFGIEMPGAKTCMASLDSSTAFSAGMKFS